MWKNRQRRPRRQWGHDRRTAALPAVPAPVSDRRVAGARLAIMLTGAAWVAYLGEWLFGDFLAGGHQTASDRAEAIAYLLIVSLLTASTLAYLLSRLGFLYRAKTHHRAGRAELDDFFEHETPTLTVLVPSYQEQANVVRKTLLSAALQEYPDTRIILLIDDPPMPRSQRSAELLAAARTLPREIRELLAEPAARFGDALAAYEARADDMPEVGGAGLLELAEHYEAAAAWLERLANEHPVVDHTDTFFVNEVVRRLQHNVSEVAAAVRDAVAEGATLSQRRVRQLYRRLAWTFRAELDFFERKQYVSLSHEPNKATNLNSYIGLMGGRYREVQTVRGWALVPVGLGACDLEVRDPDYVLTLDADSILMPEYCLRLVHLLEQQEHQRVAIAQTPYSAFPGSATRLERIAGATTDLQHIVHQGLTYYDATFWVGANAVIRKRALDDIAVTSHLGDWEVRTYIRDRTVIEDTESTIDLGTHGWKLFNYTERLSYSATPPDFGALCIQRRRWANGGLLILPKLRQQRRARRGRGEERTRFGETFLRWNYMASITWSSVSLLILLAFPFGAGLLSPLLGVVALPYFWSMASDLRQCGYKRLDVIRIYGFNLLMLPVNLSGSLASVVQGVTASKSAFARTPKVRNRTVAPAQFVIAPYLLLLLAAFTGYEAWLHDRAVNLVYAGINTLLLFYAILAFVGIRNSMADTWVFVRGLLSKPAMRKHPERRLLRRRSPAPPAVRDWRSVLQVPPGDPIHWPSRGAVIRIGGDDHEPALNDWTQVAIVFQPVVELNGDGSIVGYEALSRFRDGASVERRLADELAAGRGPVLEGRLVRAALRAAAQLPGDAWLAVKVSPALLEHDSHLLSELASYERSLVLEVPEAEAAEMLLHLQARGSQHVDLAVERAGTGYSTLRLLERIHPSYLKLDRSVCRDLLEDPVRQAAQVQSVLRVAGSTGTRVVATGIESEAVRRALVELGVPLGQGYLLGRPKDLVDA